MIDENTSSGAQMISILENRVEIIQLLAAQNVYGIYTLFVGAYGVPPTGSCR